MANIRNIETAEHYQWGEGCDGWHLVKTKQLSVIQERVPAGECEIRHYHQNAEQFFFVLSGIATIEVAGEIHTIPAHSGIHVPAGVPHKLSNLSNQELHFTVTSTPPSHGDKVLVD